MSADGKNPPPGNDPLQFDVAESSATSELSPAAAVSCKACSRPIVSSYYQVNAVVVCADCRASLDHLPGTPLRRALRATGFGIVAAIAGFLLYVAVAALTGLEFGLVAIVVGYMVGIAVRRGSRSRGGWGYQTLAIGLTYFAIVTSYLPLIIAKEIKKNAAKYSAQTQTAAPMADTITISARGPEVGRAVDSAAAAKRASDSGFAVTQAGTPTPVSKPLAVRPKRIGPGRFLLGIGQLLLLAAVIPFLGGFSNIIGLLIIGIAVFEAWKLNRRVVLNITGPYRLGAGPESTGAIG